jgi:hypothetical protein
MTNRHKVALFADRLRRLHDAYKADVESVMEDVKKAEIDPAGLRRLVSWMRQDTAARVQKELIDEQYRFLAGEVAEAPPEPTEGELATAIAMLRDKASVRQIADELKVSVGKAHKLKVLATAFIVHQTVNTVNTQPQDTAWDDADRAHAEFQASMEARRRA